MPLEPNIMTLPVQSLSYSLGCRNEHDSDSECDEWAEEDQCSLNPIWMLDNCRSSCGKCDRISGPSVTKTTCDNR